MTLRQKPTWYILGPGAIGSLWAGYFRLSGFPVVLISRSERHSNTISLDDRTDQHLVDVEHITLGNLAKSKQQVHNLLVTTKAQYTVQTLQQMKHCIADNALLLVVQNGLAAKDIPLLLPRAQLIVGITTDGAYRTDNDSVVHAGKGVTTIGSYQKSAISSSLIEQLPTDFLAIETCENIEMRQWKKLAINCLINGLTVIFDCKNGDLLGNPKALETMKSLSIEIEKIYQTLNLGLENLNELYQQALQTIALTADNYSSMYQDIHHNRKTEIDYINGYVVRRAQQIGLSCPENERILNAVKQREQSVNERSC